MTAAEWRNMDNPRDMTRRRFLVTGLGAGGACFAGAATPVNRDGSKAAAQSGLRFGLATYTWGKDWDIPTLIDNCNKAGVYGVELRTSSKYAHGVEVALGPAERATVKRQFADSPARIVSIACSERMDWPEPQKLKAAIESAKAHLLLSRDVGCDVLRVFPNQFHPEVPREKTIEQIARAVDELGVVASDLGQEVSLEAHGPVGELPTMRSIMDRVTQKSVRVRLNCDARDTRGEGFVANFNLVKPYLSKVIHLHDLDAKDYPYQTMVDELVKMRWQGWALAERGDAVADRLQALIQQRQAWDSMVAKAS